MVSLVQNFFSISRKASVSDMSAGCSLAWFLAGICAPKGQRYFGVDSGSVPSIKTRMLLIRPKFVRMLVQAWTPNAQNVMGGVCMHCWRYKCFAPNGFVSSIYIITHFPRSLWSVGTGKPLCPDSASVVSTAAELSIRLNGLCVWPCPSRRTFLTARNKAPR